MRLKTVAYTKYRVLKPGITQHNVSKQVSR